MLIVGGIFKMMPDQAEEEHFERQILALGYQLVALVRKIEDDPSGLTAWAKLGDLDISKSAFKFGDIVAKPISIGGSKNSNRKSKLPLPDPRLVRSIIRQRQLRSDFFDPEIFADPAWDILLDLAAARAEHQRVSVTSLCIASGVPSTTALRWIQQLTELGLIDRLADDRDRRRTFVSLSDVGAEILARYFAQLQELPALPI
jgi:DNA-binding MarR family transcriptional regulator